VAHRNAFNPSLEVRSGGDISDVPGLAVEEDETAEGAVEAILGEITRSPTTM
jgi:hypothetical protein